MTKRKYLRRRLLALAPAVAIAAVAIGLLTAGGGSPPPDDAAAFVPQRATLYLHLTTDRSGDGWKRARALAAKLPLASQIRDRLLATAAVPTGDLGLKGAGSWLGGEAAYAELPTRRAGRTEPLLVLAAGDQGAARAALARFRTRGSYGGLRLYDVGGYRAAIDAGWVVFGSEAALRQALDAHAGRQPALSKDAAYEKLRGELPHDRLAHAWLTAPAIERLAAGPMRLLGSAAGLGPLRDAAVSFTPKSDRFAIDLRGDSSGSAGCTPSGSGDALARRAPEKPAIFLGLGGANCLVGQALSANGSGGFSKTLGRLAQLSSSSGGLSIAHDLLPLLSKSAAVIVSPGSAQPSLTLAAADVPKGRGLATVGRLQPALVKLLDPQASGATPGFSTGMVAGQRTLSTQLNAALALDYAEIDGDLVVSNGPQGIAAAAKGSHLKDNGDYDKLLGGRPKDAASVLFLDFDRLLALADQAGLAQNPAYAAVRDDLQKIGAAGAYVAREGEQLNAELSFRNP